MQSNLIRKEVILLKKDKPLPDYCETVQKINVLSLDASQGIGTIKVLRAHTNRVSLLFDINVNEPCDVALISSERETISFIYAIQGDLTVTIDTTNEIFDVEPQKAYILKGGKNVGATLQIEPNKNVLLNVINVDVTYFEKLEEFINVNETTAVNLFQQLIHEPSFFYCGSQNFNISELIKNEAELALTNPMASIIYSMGKQHAIFAHFFEQLTSDVQQLINTSSLRISELEIIAGLSEEIRRTPEQNFSIKGLCQSSGLSPAKLQEGFKHMFDRTVSDYVRSARLERAELLLRTTDLSISEIVYTVGLTSRSYFCKIFKKKHNNSPKAYRASIRPTHSI